MKILLPMEYWNWRMLKITLFPKTSVIQLERSGWRFNFYIKQPWSQDTDETLKVREELEKKLKNIVLKSGNEKFIESLNKHDDGYSNKEDQFLLEISINDLISILPSSGF